MPAQPALTKTAGGRDLYVPIDGDSNVDIPGDLTVGKNLAVNVNATVGGSMQVDGIVSASEGVFGSIPDSTTRTQVFYSLTDQPVGGWIFNWDGINGVDVISLDGNPGQLTINFRLPAGKTPADYRGKTIVRGFFARNTENTSISLQLSDGTEKMNKTAGAGQGIVIFGAADPSAPNGCVGYIPQQVEVSV